MCVACEAGIPRRAPYQTGPYSTVDRVGSLYLYGVEDRMGQVDKNGKGRTAKSGNNTEKAERFNNNQFILYELDKSQQAECKAWGITADELLDECLALVSDGYRFSLRFDSYSQAYACFVTVDGSEHVNAGYILTGRGSTVAKALKQAIYKHKVCLDGLWAEYADRRGGDTIDD